MALGRTLYNMFFRRTSTFFVTILVGAVFLERAFDQGGDRMWERMNQGVSGHLHAHRTYASHIKDVGCMCGGTVQGLQENQLVDPALMFPTTVYLSMHTTHHLSTPREHTPFHPCRSCGSTLRTSMSRALRTSTGCGTTGILRSN